METYDESLLFFKKNCSIEKLILGETFNKVLNKKITPFLIVSILFIIYGMISECIRDYFFKNNSIFRILNYLAMIFGVIIFLITMLVNHFDIQKELIRIKLKKSKNLFKLSLEKKYTDEIHIERTKRIYDIFNEKYNIHTLISLKDITKERLTVLNGEKFKITEKTFAYFGNIILAFFIGYSINKQDINLFFKFIILGILMSISYFIIKKMLMINIDYERKNLSDYLRTLENIILMKNK